MKVEEDDEFENLRDGDLFKLVSNYDELSEKAFTVFYKRYTNDFHRLVCRIDSNQSVVENLVSQTMEQAYFRAATYEGDNTLTLKSERGKTLAWLGRIARNIYNQDFRDSKKKIKTVSKSDGVENEDETSTENATDNGFVRKGELTKKICEVENVIWEKGNFEESIISVEKSILQQVLSQLSERDRDVLLAYFEEYDPNIQNQKLSREKIKELSERYNITPDYIRKIKERTLKTVREKCQKEKTAEPKL